MSALSRRKTSAWICAACMTAVWMLKGGGLVENLVIGLIGGVAMGITLSVNRTAPPVLLTLSLCGILFSILLILAASNRPAWAFAGYAAAGVVFFISQWAYIRSFRISGTDPAGIDPSQDPGEPL
ncbi:hypothetical protein OVA24_07815 [Luteolibacter sp. SL250]|uniref:hypothetical protein n=1 Tax=Luteolibacter sp. SL250 TaxID=2995170 RepID=UPI00226F8313|nr:hypothetical protein [Luteolibacter sp. SL250]WAC21289.1 hypothetical protein OVA24_07815 [Luteolibacter sp. SL250]